MDETGGVDSGERLGEPSGEVEERVFGHGALGETASRSEGPSTNSVASHGGSASGSASSTLAVKMPATADAAATSPPEPVAELRVVGEVVADHLDRRPSAVRARRGVDPAHSADAQPAHEAIATQLFRIVDLEGLHGGRA